MEFTLLPIAAILLLLSGVGAPARNALGRPSTSALIRQLLCGAECASTALPGSTSTSAHALAHYRLPRPNTRALPIFALVPRPGAAAHKLYRTRFGFATGAYLALGPPSRT